MRVLAISVALSLVVTVAAQAGYEAAASYSDARSGLALLVYENGKLVFERYHNGHAADDPVHVFSGTKSFAPIVALIAEKERLLQLDEKVCKTITEWEGDEQRERITIRQLLNFTSGLKNNDDELHNRNAPDQYAAAIACPCSSEPGTKFEYASNHLLVFGALLQRKLAAASTARKPLPADFVAYLKDRVLDRIDCTVDSWQRDEKGNPAMSLGAHLTAREWAKFGLLVQNRGRYKGRQIVPTKHFDDCFVGTAANPGYGLNFWLTGIYSTQPDALIPRDTVAAVGLYKQLLYVIPSKKMVIVRLGQKGDEAKFDQLEFLKILLGG